MSEFNWNESMLKAREGFKSIKKDQKGHNYKYADINSVLDMIEPPLAKQGFYIEQEPISEKIGIKTTIYHTSGQKKEYAYIPPADFTGVNQRGIQACGSVITYLRRYHLVAIFSLKCEDDDGQMAVKSFEKPINNHHQPPVNNPSMAPVYVNPHDGAPF